MISILSNWRGYLELTKPGVQALLFVSCASGMLIGSDFTPPVQVFFFGLIGISFLAASSAVINHFFDQKIDSKMNRTSERPLVVGNWYRTRASKIQINRELSKRLLPAYPIFFLPLEAFQKFDSS